MAWHEAARYLNPQRVCPRCNNAQEHKPRFPCFGMTSGQIEALKGECPDCLLVAVIKYNNRGFTVDTTGTFITFITYSKEALARDRANWRRETMRKSNE